MSSMKRNNRTLQHLRLAVILLRRRLAERHGLSVIPHEKIQWTG